MWNSFLTDGPAGVHAEITTIPVPDGDPIHAYVARPAGDQGPYPGVILIHHMPGWDEFYQEFAERIARHGYLVVAPDLYCRFGHGAPDDIAALARKEGGVHDDTVVDYSAAARDYLRQQLDSNGKAGIMGSCSGGRHALLAASRLDGIDAVVDLWGGGVMPKEGPPNPARPVAPVEYTSSLSAPLLGIFGNDDKNPTPEDVNAHEAELRKQGKRYTFHRYDNASHGFFYYHKDAYRPEQTMDAWEKIFAFYTETLAS
jgi:carboxymethylenebutenolidase